MNRSASAVMAFAITVVAGFAHAQGNAPAGDAKAGAQKVQMCQGCHGIAGWRTAFPEVYHVPKIGGQHAQYILASLKAYRSGERKHPSMRAIALSLTDKDMADLAAYYAEDK
jgi:cytochrome c553